ncbi:LysR family transcriptional regulator [Nordella sp. HKS 07]|uniref:LysR family transcriptional regulator n=1 Tax=Nordella sp. HKS 07 TaxID=2712222 RepID=UPI0013E17695|nr:LysR family transcriptional regulator [Nordella sp. HKS 07]QIG46362.1 LysR family transcriptional regulator [Nordella sp. HKS 07]
MQPNPTLDQLQILLAVAETGSFSGAGRKLNRAQSVISYGIANLEAQLGVKLFEREGTREPQLTEMGKAILEDARRMAGVMQRIRARVEGFNRGLESEVAVAIDPVLPAPVLIRTLRAFAQEFPTVGLRLNVGSLGSIVDQVVKGEADIGIGAVPGEADVRLIEIGLVTMVPVASPDHPLARLKGPVPLEDLREHTQLVVTDPSQRTRGRDFSVFAFRIWRLTDMHTKHLMIRAGLGWGGLPGWIIAEDLRQGLLVELDLEPYGQVQGPFFAMHRTDRQPGPAASWLIDIFKSKLGCFNEAAPDGLLPADLDGDVTRD